MTANVQCPNAACGQVSRLGDDPLGRIFRCPHCRTKLPTASAARLTQGGQLLWVPHGLVQDNQASGRFELNVGPDPILPSPRLLVTPGNLGFPGRAVLVDEFDLNSARDARTTWHSNSGLGPDDSGEVLILPVLPDGRSGSAWGAMSKSSMSAFDEYRGNAGSMESNLLPALSAKLGRFRILSLLGEGEHATVYRAYDPILERDVALKVPRQGVLKTAKVLDRFLGEAKASRGYGIPGSCQCMKPAMPVSGTISPWH